MFTWTKKALEPKWPRIIGHQVVVCLWLLRARGEVHCVSLVSLVCVCVHSFLLLLHSHLPILSRALVDGSSQSLGVTDYNAVIVDCALMRRYHFLTSACVSSPRDWPVPTRESWPSVAASEFAVVTTLYVNVTVTGFLHRGSHNTFCK